MKKKKSSERSLAINHEHDIDAAIDAAIDYQGAVEELEKIRDDLSQILSQLFEENNTMRAELAVLKGQNLSGESVQDHHENQVNRTEPYGQQIDDLKQELDLYKEENKLILENMFLTQEELESQLVEREGLQDKCQSLNDRLDRLARHYPYHLDFGVLRVESFDAVSSEPYIICLLEDCSVAQYHFSQIKFKLQFQHAQVGIEILTVVSESLAMPKKWGLIFPGLVNSSSEHFKAMQKIQTSGQWIVIKSAVMAIRYAIESAWKDISLPDHFDSNFWSSALIKLVKDFDLMSPALRFDGVHLKQESINLEYEHLWLELYGVTFGSLSLPKMEIRIGAANLEPNKFSNFPKIEIPLIDGTLKPFESWFAESFDDYGAKYELRFDLDKARFDINVWSKLTSSDRNFLFGLIAALPKALLSLGEDRKSLGRPLKAWFDFATNTKNVLYDYLKQTQLIQAKKTTKKNALHS